MPFGIAPRVSLPPPQPSGLVQVPLLFARSRPAVGRPGSLPPRPRSRSSVRSWGELILPRLGAGGGGGARAPIFAEDWCTWGTARSGGGAAQICLDMSHLFSARPGLAQLYAPQPSTQRGFGVKIGAHPREGSIIYGAGKTVVVQDLSNPAASFVYRGHRAKVTVARFSPNGYWVASGDATGLVKVWSWDNEEHPIKFEGVMLGGGVADLAWDAESKRIVVVGDGGGGVYCRAFTYDSGNSVGEMIGHTKRVTCCATRPNRPYRVLTGGEDFSVVLYKGPPFRKDHTISGHSNWVHAVAFSPDGSRCASVSSDKKLVIYEGREAEVLQEVEDAHGGTIYDVCFSPDGSCLATCSADKTLKLWRFGDSGVSAFRTFSAGDGVGDMQLGVTWKDDLIITLSLSGDLRFHAAEEEAPLRIQRGHQGGVTCLSSGPDGASMATGSADGTVCLWTEGVAAKVTEAPNSMNGALHAGNVVAACLTAYGLVTCAWDDAIKVVDPATLSVMDAVGTAGQPQAMASPNFASDKICVASVGAVTVHTLPGVSSAPSASIAVGFTPLSVSMSGDEGDVAVGGDDDKIHIFAFGDGELHEGPVLEGHRGNVTCLAFSPDCAVLAAGDAFKEVKIWDTSTWEPRISGRWVFHTTRVLCLAWNEASTRLASGAGDDAIIVWNLEEPAKRQKVQNAHAGGVRGVSFADMDTLLSCGNDGCISTWALQDL